MVTNTCLQRYLSAVARHHRALKIRLKRQIAGSSNHNKSNLSTLLTKKIAKDARNKRKIIMLDKRIQKNNQDPQPYRALHHLMRLYSRKPTQTVNLQRAIELAPFNERRAKQPVVSTITSTSPCNPAGPPFFNLGGPSIAPSNKLAVARTFPSYFGPPTHTCVHCGAMLWYEERIQRNKQTSNPQFTFCCMEGRVKLPLLKEPPHLLKHLLGPSSGQLGRNFQRNLRTYNSLFAIASLGAQGISNKVAAAHAIHQKATTIWQSHSMFIHDRVPKKGKRFHVPDLQLTKQQIEAYTLIEVEGLMQKLGKSLRDIDGMPQPDSSLTRDLGNRLLNEELDYDRPKLKALHQKNINALNESQKKAYDAIVQSVQLDEGKIFFVSGHGGTGKTFLWNTITSKFRSESMIVLPVATSGIASLLLPNGRTAHSRFRIPLDVTAESTCEIKHGTQLAKLLQKTSLIIWDEAPMTNKYCFEALDKTLRDILSTRYENSRSRPFGGITVVFGGDFRQILPVIPQGSRSDIIDASLNSSYLWPYFEIYELKQNMRLQKEGISEVEAESIALFDKWLLQIGDGSMYDDVEQELIRIPPDICKPPTEEPIKEIVDVVYPSLLENYKNPAYLKERAILTPKNEMVDELNGYLMNVIPGEGRTYLSSDSVCKASIKTDDDDLLYPPEFLHTLQFSGIPNHDIKLKEGTPIMLLRNLNQSEGLCNGTRLIVTRLGKWSIRDQDNGISGDGVQSGGDSIL
ncbi:ATP-dependent DNA helicase [Heracleum sosnowskyi]|uniref:ATP-dependent DNA helicase n=1 Tax=Heracleum sosnowskyi TaxID=360622 RepID=A0AAD8GR44_9APIA|nr:ATP-dependent DNA helicase [Heracleum sosnowskyi]